MNINFTESDIEDMLEVLLQSDGTTKKVFTWSIDGQEVNITVGNDG
jgi:hypothetical protein